MVCYGMVWCAKACPSSRLVWRTGPKPVDKVGPPLHPAARLWPDRSNGDTRRKTKPSLRAMAHMHYSCTWRVYVKHAGLSDMGRESETLRPPPSLNAICWGGSPPSPPSRPQGLRPVGGSRLWRPAGALGVLRAAAAAWAAIYLRQYFCHIFNIFAISSISSQIATQLRACTPEPRPTSYL